MECRFISLFCTKSYFKKLKSLFNKIHLEMVSKYFDNILSQQMYTPLAVVRNNTLEMLNRINIDDRSK